MMSFVCLSEKWTRLVCRDKNRMTHHRSLAAVDNRCLLLTYLFSLIKLSSVSTAWFPNSTRRSKTSFKVIAAKETCMASFVCCRNRLLFRTCVYWMTCDLGEYYQQSQCSHRTWCSDGLAKRTVHIVFGHSWWLLSSSWPITENRKEL